MRKRSKAAAAARRAFSGKYHSIRDTEYYYCYYYFTIVTITVILLLLLLLLTHYGDDVEIMLIDGQNESSESTYHSDADEKEKLLRIMSVFL